jgi:hypothetical protein
LQRYRSRANEKAEPQPAPAESPAESKAVFGVQIRKTLCNTTGEEQMSGEFGQQSPEQERSARLTRERDELAVRVKVLEDALLGMNSHMERMQATASSYLEPWQGATDTEQSFINAMLYLLDGPEQREVQGKARAELIRYAGTPYGKIATEAEDRGFERGVREAADACDWADMSTREAILALLEPVTPQKPEA